MTQTTHDAADDADAEMFRRLRRLKEDTARTCSNKHDLATIMIMACIEEGLATGARIVGALKALGFHGAHIALTFKSGATTHPGSGYWMQTSDGVYQLHEQA